MTHKIEFDDEPDDERERPEKALLERYLKRFGRNPAFFNARIYGGDLEGALREALETGTPIDLDIEPGTLA